MFLQFVTESPTYVVLREGDAEEVLRAAAPPRRVPPHSNVFALQERRRGSHSRSSQIWHWVYWNIYKIYEFLV